MGVTREINIGEHKLYMNSVRTKKKSYPVCDRDGNVLKKERVGSPSSFVYKDDNDNEVPKSEQFYLLELPDGTTKAATKLKATKTVKKFEVIDNLEQELRGFQTVEMLYVVNSQSAELKKQILEEGRSIKFAFTSGNGFKVYRAYLTNYNGKIVMYGCQGNAEKELSKFEFDEDITLDDGLAQNTSVEEMEEILDY